MDERLAKLEERMEALFEGTIPRLLGARLTSAAIARQVAKAMEDGALRDDEGVLVAPDTFLLEMHPEDYILLLEAEPDLPKLISQVLLGVARGAGYHLAKEPTVRFIPDLQVDGDRLQVAWIERRSFPGRAAPPASKRKRRSWSFLGRRCATI
jgi:hypothetical protein